MDIVKLYEGMTTAWARLRSMIVSHIILLLFLWMLGVPLSLDDLAELEKFLSDEVATVFPGAGSTALGFSLLAVAATAYGIMLNELGRLLAWLVAFFRPIHLELRKCIPNVSDRAILNIAATLDTRAFSNPIEAAERRRFEESGWARPMLLKWDDPNEWIDKDEQYETRVHLAFEARLSDILKHYTLARPPEFERMMVQAERGRHDALIYYRNALVFLSVWLLIGPFMYGPYEARALIIILPSTFAIAWLVRILRARLKHVLQLEYAQLIEVSATLASSDTFYRNQAQFAHEDPAALLYLVRNNYRKLITIGVFESMTYTTVARAFFDSLFLSILVRIISTRKWLLKPYKPQWVVYLGRWLMNLGRWMMK